MAEINENVETSVIEQESVSEIVENREVLETTEMPEDPESAENIESTESTEVFPESTEIVELPEDNGENAADETIYVEQPAADYTEVLNTISETLTDIAESGDVYISTYAVNSSGDLDGYFFSYGSDKVYIPYDKISYFSETEDGQLINFSSGTVTCYAVAGDGTTGTTYRFPSFGTAQRYTASGNYYTWEDIAVYADDTNLILGQTGINNMTDMLLFFIVVLLGMLVFVRRK